MVNPLLQVAALSHRYGDTPVLADIDLSIAAGHLTAVLGSSGVGKSTLLRAIAGFVTPNTGTIALRGSPMVIDGREVTPAELRGVGMVFQDHALFPHMSAAENIGFGLASWTPEERAARVEEMLALIGLDSRADTLPGALSGGQRQRVALARALAPRPSILLLDEPFASLDADLRRDLADELRAIMQQESVAALLVTHDHRAALAWCDTVAVLGADEADGPGRLHQHDTPEGVYNRPTTETAARLTGEVVGLDGEASGGTVATQLGPLPLVTPHEGRVRLLLRPERLQFTTDPSGEAQVVKRTFEGATVRLTVDGPAGTMRLNTSALEVPETGARGTVTHLGEVWAIPAP